MIARIIKRMQDFLRHLMIEIHGWGAGGALVFIPVYIIASILFIPGALLNLMAGAIYGTPMGCLLVSVSSTLSAGAVFLAGRYLSRGWILKKISTHPKVKLIDEEVGKRGWKMVMMLRFAAILPFSVLNYGLGLSRIRFRDYILTSWLAMMPGSFLYVYLGHFAREAVLEGSPRQRTPMEWAMVGLGLAVTLGMIVYSVRAIKKIPRLP